MDSVVQARPASLDATSDPPTLFDGTTRLYTSYICPFAQRVWITRNIKGLQEKIKLVPLDLGNRPAWYKEKVYPENKVPALEHNGKIIGESLDLIKYLDNTFEGPSLYPEDHAKREFGEELLNYTDTFVKTMFVALKGDPSKETAPVLDYLENALHKFDDGPFFIGLLSLVDIAYITFIDMFQVILNEIYKCDITAERPKLSAWVEEMNKIDAFAETKIDPKEIVEIFKKKYMVLILSDPSMVEAIMPLGYGYLGVNVCCFGSISVLGMIVASGPDANRALVNGKEALRGIKNRTKPPGMDMKYE
ncbi:unnamed protein product [Thlaspi arvense]|uniref:glutathione transferase n=1 Tax=Thlaspi arvense TaxID=13288 RepID=A0AAU9RAT5_THLAR|nr:unnamed protein product [Thlaspi arvense]